MEYFIALIYIYLCVSESFKKKLYKFPAISYFYYKEPHLRSCIELELNILIWSSWKILKIIWGHRDTPPPPPPPPPPPWSLRLIVALLQVFV